MIKFTISIAVHNLLGQTRDCLNSILDTLKYNQDLLEKGGVEIIIVDNGSTGLMEMLSEMKQSLRQQDWAKGKVFLEALRKEENEGYIKAHNDMMFYAKGEYVVIMNNDMVVEDNDWLWKMEQKFAENIKLQMLGVRSEWGKLKATGYGDL